MIMHVYDYVCIYIYIYAYNIYMCVYIYITYIYMCIYIYNIYIYILYNYSHPEVKSATLNLNCLIRFHVFLLETLQLHHSKMAAICNWIKMWPI